MAEVLSNENINSNYYLIKVKNNLNKEVLPGQFFMLRAWDDFPVLSRPISIYNATKDTLEFLYEVRGKGTKIISELKIGDDMNVYGPYGNSFNTKNINNISLVGGGVGNAPFYYVAKEILKENKNARIDFYIGEREEQSLEEAFNDLNINLIIQKGGFVTDILKYDNKIIYTCGPQIMMEKVTKLALENDCIVYTSLEARMGCGVGACLSCSCKTTYGNKRICKDGPIFKGVDVF